MGDYFQSLVHQSFGLENLEIIFVDDGSTDATLAVAQEWAAAHPQSISVIEKKNGGVASARNRGLQHASGEWVTFIDPDDCVATDYFERIDDYLTTHENAQIDFISSNIIPFEDASGKKLDNHPLKERFAKGDRHLPIASINDEIHLSGATMFLRLDVLKSLSLEFSVDVVPDFEDAHLAARYMLHSRGQIALMASAKYYYRRRSDGSSLLQTSWASRKKYRESLLHGCLPLISLAQSQHGLIPEWLQRTILYHLVWYFKLDARYNPPTRTLTEDVTAEFHRLVRAILRDFDESIVRSFQLGGPDYRVSNALLSYLAAKPEPSQLVLSDVDAERGLLLARLVFHDDRPEIDAFIDGVRVEPIHAKDREHCFFNRTLFRERLMWLPFPSSAGVLHVQVDGQPHPICVGDEIPRTYTQPDTYLVKRLPWVRRRFGKRSGLRPRRMKRRHALKTRVLRRLATSAWAARRFGNAWILMDRDSQADDNAEHLYRWIRDNRSDTNVWYFLNRDSHDWSRLKRDRFRLINFGSPLRLVALMNAKVLISSHIDRYIVDPIDRRDYGDLTDFRFVFLQHGVTKDDMSTWFNSKKPDLIVTSTPAEHESIVGDGSPYKFTTREVVRTGFPRHDALAAKAKDAPKPSRVLLMPTWRASLLGPSTGKGNARSRQAEFEESQFARRWKEVLHSAELAEICTQRGLRLTFMLHANMEPYFDWFDPPEGIESYRHKSTSIQDLFVESVACLTDFSSVPFELAFLGRPTVYFQFDRDTFFRGDHPWRPGYFDYERDGFGPVIMSPDQIPEALTSILDPTPELETYRERMRACFPPSGSAMSEAVFNAICDIWRKDSTVADMEEDWQRLP
ncbi:MAG: CDP-glycerol glycerophosphotransferase family protein [Nitriliruptoraceae bacterium]|nr:CDP-glycerol glycerophosphotransferase family protein [Nitriliruptoraceae bacterium]